jgi:O-antigen ligase
MAFVLFRSGGLKVYAIDLLYLLLVGAYASYVRRDWRSECGRPEFFFMFATYLGLRTLVSVPVYGMSAIGELRYFLPLFAVFVPFFLFRSASRPKVIAEVIIATVFVSGIVSLLLLGLELIYGGRFFFAPENADFARMEDFRGARFLGSEETVNLALLVCTLILMGSRVRNRGGWLLLLSLTFFAVVITRNRTAPFAVFSGFAFLLLILGRFRVLLRGVGMLCVVLVLVALVAPSAMNQALTAFESLGDIGSDETGRWRVLIQITALEEAIRTPIFGEGLGGYFSLQVPTLETLVEEPPHSAYIHLFWKAGIIAPGLVIGSMIVLLVRAAKVVRRARRDDIETIALEVCMVIVLAQFLYGLAYGFSVFFGLYSGCGFALLRALQADQESSATLGMKA